MARIVLTRATPLRLDEAAELPEGATVDNGDAGARVVVEHDSADLDGLIQAAVALGRALPDAALTVEDLAVAAPASAAPRPTYTRAAPSDAALGQATVGAWKLFEAGQHDEAVAAFQGASLDGAGRDRVRDLLHSTDPAQVALACRIAAATDWRSFVSQMRRVLDHGDGRVRAQAVRAIGALAGPAMIWHLEKLSEDASPEVREAVAAAITEIEGRQG
ncbi:MAG: HEAT repeat domain-containing protein [Alphaproteobacteria bacterium]|nr:HEAT repeat domain-containing protein [Alphaproteobacteria bacterium]